MATKAELRRLATEMREEAKARGDEGARGANKRDWPMYSRRELEERADALSRLAAA